MADPRAQEEETSFGAHEPQEEPAAPPEAGAGADEESNGNSSAGRRKRGEGELKDRNAGIKPVGDVNFVPSNGVPLKAFFAEKDPTSDMDQILVLCYYLQDTLQIPKYGPGHILTGFRHVERPVPKDLRQTIRNMKKKAWVNFTDIGDIRLTTEGENRVKFGLGKRGKDSGD